MEFEENCENHFWLLILIIDIYREEFVKAENYNKKILEIHLNCEWLMLFKVS